MKTPRLFYVWSVPIAWGACCYIAFDYPGDEYGFWVIGSAAGAWIAFFIQNVGDVQNLRTPVVATGVCTMAVFGLLMDLVRLRPVVFGIAWCIAGTLIGFSTISSYGSYETAMAKNGSLAAYVLFAFNAGLCVAIVLTVPPVFVLRIGRRVPRNE